LPKSAAELVKKVGKHSLNRPFYFRSAGHLLQKVGIFFGNNLRQRVIWSAAQVKSWGPFVLRRKKDIISHIADACFLQIYLLVLEATDFFY